jgi:hypothetical protein
MAACAKSEQLKRWSISSRLAFRASLQLHFLALLALVVLVMLLASCSGVTKPPVANPDATPTISEFSANPSSISAGTSSTLTWRTSGATNIAIGPGGFASTAASGSTTVSPSATTAYTLTASNGAGTATSAATVTVTASGAPKPTITSFIASPSSITAGASSTLSWVSSGATGITISPGGFTSTATSGSTTVSPSATTAYTLTASNGADTVTSSTTVTVTASGAAKPTITSFIASPSSITAGASSTLSWVTTGATGIAISPGGFTSTAASGSTTVSPSATTAYTLTATNNAGSVTSSATVTVTTGTTPSACSGMSLGAEASFNGFVPFPSNNPWNENISSAPVDPNSSTIINYIGASTTLHPDFDSIGDGIPYIVVDSSVTPLVNVTLADSSQSDLMPMPFPANAPIEGGSDHHVLVADRNTCWLYEVWEGAYSGGQWSANNSAVWDLENYNNRIYTWTSADAAGLPILPGLVRYDEVSAGAINHALRFTVPNTWAAFVSPATHWAQTNSGSPIPMGMRIRLKASFDISGFSAENQAILTAMKTYGLILADNGSAIYVTGTADTRWDDNDLHNLTTVVGSDFEVVQIPTEIDSGNVPTGAAPVINSFTASPTTVSAGAAVTLTWSTSAASYLFIDPSVGTQVGTVRGTSVIVNPSATTAYTLSATNSYGRTTASVTVQVQ